MLLHLTFCKIICFTMSSRRRVAGVALLLFATLAAMVTLSFLFLQFTGTSNLLCVSLVTVCNTCREGSWLWRLSANMQSS